MHLYSALNLRMSIISYKHNFEEDEWQKEWQNWENDNVDDFYCDPSNRFAPLEVYIVRTHSSNMVLKLLLTQHLSKIRPEGILLVTAISPLLFLTVRNKTQEWLFFELYVLKKKVSQVGLNICIMPNCHKFICCWGNANYWFLLRVWKLSLFYCIMVKSKIKVVFWVLAFWLLHLI